MNEVEKIEFNPTAKALAEKIIKRYPEGKQKSALLPLLHLAQAEFGGWLSPQTMDYVASTQPLVPAQSKTARAAMPRHSKVTIVMCCRKSGPIMNV